MNQRTLVRALSFSLGFLLLCPLPVVSDDNGLQTNVQNKTRLELQQTVDREKRVDSLLTSLDGVSIGTIGVGCIMVLTGLLAENSAYQSYQAADTRQDALAGHQTIVNLNNFYQLGLAFCSLGAAKFLIQWTNGWALDTDEAKLKRAEDQIQPLTTEP